MFTGTVEELARVKKIETKDKGMHYIISAYSVMDDLDIGDSISVNGVCLTVTERHKESFSMELVEENIQDLQIKVDELKQSTAWVWYNCKSSEEKDMLARMILSYKGIEVV